MAVLHCPTIKPLDEAAILEAVRYKHRLVVVAENHSVIGGLGEAVASALLRHRRPARGLPARRAARRLPRRRRAADAARPLRHQPQRARGAHQGLAGLSLTKAPDVRTLCSGSRDAIRFLAIDAIVRAGEGHQGVPLGMAEIATALYTRHLKFDAADPTWPDRDRVVLSNGHGSMLLYALIHLSGYERIGIER